MTDQQKCFLQKIDRQNDDACWNWIGCYGSDGYGHFRWDGRVMAAHRVAFIIFQERSPIGHVLHSCDNTGCCNPAHLREGTHKENMEDCVIRGRNRSPRLGNGFRKLSDQDIIFIASRYHQGETNKSALAREFGVSPTRIRQIIQAERIL